MKTKRIITFLKCLPVIVNMVVETWKIVKEIYSEDFQKQIEKIKEEAKEEEKRI